jgi:hypothetical protein
MAITRVPTGIPNELPHARLFLDEIKAIEEILKTELGRSSPTGIASVKYLLNGETRCDSLEDLEEIGGSVEKFGLEVTIERENRYGETASFDIGDVARVWTQQLPSDVRWAIYGKVRNILFARRLKLSYVLNTFSNEMQGVIWAIGTMAGLGAGTLVIIRVLSSIFHPVHHISFAPLGVVAAFAALLSLLVFLANRKGRVYLYYHHSIERERRLHRKSIILDLIKILVGAVLGVIGTLVVRWIVHGNGQ